MSALELQLKQLEMNVTEQFGDGSDEYMSDELPEESTDADIAEDVTGNNTAVDEYDPLYCIACSKAFKSDKA